MGHWHLSSAEPLPDHNGFTIHPTSVTSCIDQRTTLIVKNIPTKMTQLRFKAMLCNDFMGKCNEPSISAATDVICAKLAPMHYATVV